MSVNTVLGPIEEDDLGFALMHEHLYLGNWNCRVNDPEWINYNAAKEMIVDVINDAKKNGVNSLVDCTTFNIGRDVKLIKEVSEETGMNIIVCGGVYVDEGLWIKQISEENLVKSIVKDINNAQGMGIKCGAIKCGTDRFGFTDNNRKILRACAKSALITSLPLITHCRPANTRQGLFQQDIFEEIGVDLRKVMIGHYRNGDSLDYAINVMKRGSYIAIDQMNFNEHELDFNLKRIIELCRLGFANKLILSHDAVICYNTSSWKDWDVKTYINYASDSLSYIKRKVVPLLLDNGVSPEDVKKIFYINPRKLLGHEI